MGKGKHFIGDFLPPEELEKFMETFKALKVSGPLTVFVVCCDSPLHAVNVQPHICFQAQEQCGD